MPGKIGAGDIREKIEMARTDLVYPKILDSKHCPIMKRCTAFEKYDGTNMHWVWERELSWYAFGTRRSRYDLDSAGIAEFSAAHRGLEEAPQVFLATLAKPLAEMFQENPDYNCPEITVFTELLGTNSFAGMHKREDPKRLVLFDVQIEKSMIGPESFIRDFQGVNSARIVYQGKLTGKFIQDVREGKYDVQEGVVCKGGEGENLWMVKIKTNAYKKKLQEMFRGEWERYWE